MASLIRREDNMPDAIFIRLKVWMIDNDLAGVVESDYQKASFHGRQPFVVSAARESISIPMSIARKPGKRTS